MRFEFDPLEAPEIARAEALQQIALQLERIADAQEDDSEGVLDV